MILCIGCKSYCTVPVQCYIILCSHIRQTSFFCVQYNTAQYSYCFMGAYHTLALREELRWLFYFSWVEIIAADNGQNAVETVKSYPREAMSVGKLISVGYDTKVRTRIQDNICTAEAGGAFSHKNFGDIRKGASDVAQPPWSSIGLRRIAASWVGGLVLMLLFQISPKKIG